MVIRDSRHQPMSERSVDDLEALAFTGGDDGEPEAAPAVVVVEDTPDAHQQAAIDAVVLRLENVFITGPAGSGKSYTLQHIIDECKSRNRRVAVTSSTGRSAVELGLGATTLHGFLALGDVGNRSVSDYVSQLQHVDFKEPRERVATTDVLIIDEVSMLSAETLSKFERIVAEVRRDKKVPWGGMQIVFAGDFAQLRPVPPRTSGKRKSSSSSVQPQLAFHASVAWKQASVVVYSLTELHRQADDESYGALLDRVRFAAHAPEDIAVIRERIITASRARQLADSSVFLFSRNAQVDEHNAERLQALDESTSRLFEATKQISVKHNKVTKKRSASLIRTNAERFIQQSMRALPTLELRVGARVMLLANLDVKGGLSNGSTGTITGYDDVRGFPKVHFDNGRDFLVVEREWTFDDLEWHGSYKQVPLVLAWATSIHKSQGLTLDSLVADLSPRACFSAGMAYVVMSRVRKITSLHLTSFSSSAIYADADMLQFYREHGQG